MPKYNGSEAVYRALGNLQDGLSDLNDLREEYEEWYDNMPEGLQSGATGDKIQELLNLDFESAKDQVDE
jgi:hypothetical protein